MVDKVYCKMSILFSLILSIVLLMPGNAQGLLSKNKSVQLFTKGIELFQREKYSAAQHYFEEYLKLHEDHLKTADAHYYHAYCAIKLLYPHGEALFHRFIEEYPTHPKAVLAYYELGNLYFSNQDFEKSITYYQKVDKSQLDETTKHALAYHLAYAYLNNKDFDQALSHFNLIKVNSNPYVYAANYYTGYIALRNGDYAVALTDLQKAAENDTYKSVVPSMILQVYYQQKRFRVLLAYIKEVDQSELPLSNQNEMRLLTAEAHFFLGDFEAAFQNYETYIAHEDAPVASPILYRVAYSLYKIKKIDKALTYFKTLALQEDSFGQLSSYYLGKIYLQTDKKTWALGAFEKAHQADFLPKVQEEATFQYAKLHYELGNFATAIKTFKKFKVAYPKSKHQVEANALLSKAYFNTNDYHFAIAHIEALPYKHQDIMQVYQKVTFYKGNEYFNDAQYEHAIDLFKKSFNYPFDKKVAIQTQLWLGESLSALQNYQCAIAAYDHVLAAKAFQNTPFYRQALYGLAYAYFNTSDYNAALLAFAQYAAQAKDMRHSPFFQDALIRLADCYYATKDYQQAIRLYTQAIQQNNPAIAHAYYQKGLIHGILGEMALAQASFTTIFQNYTHTIYYEQALFKSAQLVFEQGSHQEAIESFTNFMQKQPQSSLLPEALLNRAIASVNLKKYDLAYKDCETLLHDYPTHAYAESALWELQKITTLEGKPERFNKYLASYKAANPTDQSLERIAFEAAKALVNEEHYAQAVEYLNAFAANYPHSALQKEACFLVAEAYYRLEDEKKALENYHKALKDYKSPWYNKIIGRIAHLAYKQQDFSQALKYYHLLEAQAKNKREIYYARSGMMKSHAALQDYDSVAHYASLILEQGNVVVNATNEATLFLGKAAMHKGEKQQAVDYFLQIINIAKDSNAVEAQYLLATICYDQKQYRQSLELLFDLHKQFPAYKTWVDKAFLLIADNYIALEEVFQASATLNSIIENASDKSSIANAQQKLAALKIQITRQIAPDDTEKSEFKILEK